MNSSKYKISKSALIDLRKIWAYTQNKWSTVQAERYYSRLIEEINYIADHPESGKEIDDIRKDYKCSKVKYHFIFYRINKKGLVEIVRILHEMMDIPKRIKE